MTTLGRGLLVLTIGFGLAIGTAEAGSKHGKSMRHTAMMQELDSNGDRQLSRDEFRIPAVRMFQRLDGNEDGQLTSDELMEVRKIRRQLAIERALERQGADGISRSDFVSAAQSGMKRGGMRRGGMKRGGMRSQLAGGLLMRPEHDPAQRREQREKLFSMLDSDGNDRLSAEELQGRREASQQLRFQTLDADSNGRVEQEEFLSRADKVFARLDANADNSVSEKEIGKHMRMSLKRMKKHHRRGRGHQRQGF